MNSYLGYLNIIINYILVAVKGLNHNKIEEFQIDY